MRGIGGLLMPDECGDWGVAGGARTCQLRREALPTQGVAATRVRPIGRLADFEAHDGRADGVTVVVPTRNEEDNVVALMDRLAGVHRTLGLEIVFVDDSTDATTALIRDCCSAAGPAVTLIHRTERQRRGGLGSAVLTGIQAARHSLVCVMDADLQHPPEMLGALVDEARRTRADVVVASRYCAGGDVGAFPPARRAVSHGARLLARALFPHRLRDISDPLSGFFVVRRSAIDPSVLRPSGFKVLLEILVCQEALTVREVPLRFGERHAGASKASVAEGGRYLFRLIGLRFGGRQGEVPAQSAGRREQHRPGIPLLTGKEGLVMQCPQCGTPIPEADWNCPSCRLNVYWATQHYRDLAAARSSRGMLASPTTPAFLIAAHREAMSERAATDGARESKVRRIARATMARSTREAGATDRDDA